MTYCPTCGAQVADGANYCTACGAVMPTRVQYSGFWRRFASLALDSIIIGIPVSLVLSATSLTTGPKAALEGLVFIFYAASLVGRRGQTVGMRAMRITCTMSDGSLATSAAAYTRAVVRVGLNGVSLLAFALAPPVTVPAGQALTASQLAAEHRFVTYFFVLAVPYLLDVLWMLWSPRRQTLHDLAARTVVVRSEVPVATPALPPLRP